MKCRYCPAWYPIDEVDGYCEIREVITPLKGSCKFTEEEVKNFIEGRCEDEEGTTG